MRHHPESAPRVDGAARPVPVRPGLFGRFRGQHQHGSRRGNVDHADQLLSRPGRHGTDLEGRHAGGDKPSKEVFPHRALFATRPGTGTGTGAHLHSTYATALSCLETTDLEDAIPPVTPYVVLRVGRMKVSPYVRPGDPRIGDKIRALQGDVVAMLPVNHGPVVSARDLEGAVFVAEELKETGKLLTLLGSRP